MKHGLERELQDAVGSAYRITRELVRGGMSHVFLAEDVARGRRVVIKLLAPELASSVNEERFRREIKVALALRHRHIVPVADVGETGQRLFYVMPFVEGESLRALLARERQLPIDQAIAIACDVASALDFANQHNIVHRDIKPDNILIDCDGRALVTDFGIARAIERSADLVSVTSTGLTLGTPTYMSPEQAAAEPHVDGRSDIYSLGCVLYEMLAGEPPFTGPTAQAVIARHMQEPPRELRIVRRELSPDLQDVIEQALAKSPADRPRTAAAFAAALRNPPPARSIRSGSTDIVPEPTPNRSRGWTMAAGLLIVATAATFSASRFGGLFSTNGAPAAALDPTRVAVLEFEDQSQGRVLGHIASGLTVSLVHELAGVSALDVISRSRLRTLQERAVPLDTIISQLRIGSLVEGSVQHSNGRLRVSVQLVDARTHSPLESATIERAMGEIFRLEDDVTQEVAVLLRKRIGAEVRVRATIAGTRSARARDLSFRAGSERERALQGASSPDSAERDEALSRLHVADSLLAEAERADPRWMAATIDRGWIAVDVAQRRGGDARRQAFRQAVAHADRALARVPHAPEALELRGTARYWEAARVPLSDSLFRDRLHRAEQDLRESVERDSTRTAAWGTLSLVHVALGEIAAAERTARVALAMDSFLDDAVTIHLALIGAYVISGNYGQLAQRCARGRADFPEESRFVQCELTLMAEDSSRAPDTARARALLATADSLEPRARAAVFGREYLPLYRQVMVAVVLARAGNGDEARRIVSVLRRQVEASEGLALDLAYDDAYLQLVLGDRAQALRLLTRYIEQRRSLRGLVSRHARWRALQGDAAFLALVTHR